MITSSNILRRVLNPVARSFLKNGVSRARGLAWISIGILATVAGCKPTVQNDPNFFVSTGGNRERSTFVPTGGGWIPSSQIEIALVAEPQRTPDGEIFAANSRVIGAFSADSIGMFGFDANPFNYVVARSICGSPPAWLQTPFFVARDKVSGLVRTSSVGNHNWFTFEPCH